MLAIVIYYGVRFLAALNVFVMSSVCLHLSCVLSDFEKSVCFAFSPCCVCVFAFRSRVPCFAFALRGAAPLTAAIHVFVVFWFTTRGPLHPLQV